MMTKSFSSILVVMLLAMFGDESLAFQPLPFGLRARRDVSTKLSSALYYKNKTDEAYETTTTRRTTTTKTTQGNNNNNNYHDELDRQFLEYYKRFGGIVPMVTQEDIDDDDDDDLEGSYLLNADDDSLFAPINPTLDLLKKWTEEYIEAVDMAGGGITRISVSVEDMMAPEFVLTSPAMGPINKPDFIRLMKFYHDCGFDIASAIPDFKAHYDGWHVDPHEPWRIWAVVRYSGTHTGTAIVPQSGLRLTPPNSGDHEVQFMTGPEMHSFLWTPDKKILWQTMGFVGDSFTGSNQGKGGLEGLMVSMGLPTLYLDSTAPLRRTMGWFSQFSDNGKEPRSKTPYSQLPQWWHERKTYDLNVHR